MEISNGDMGQDDILLMGDSQFVMTPAKRYLSERAHLCRRCITGRLTMAFKTYSDRRISQTTVRFHIAVNPLTEPCIAINC